MSNGETQNLIAEVFRLTGQRIDENDPIVAVLLMQQELLETSLAEFDRSQDASREVFLRRLSESEARITAAAAKMETYREQLLLELLQKSDHDISQLEDRVYAGVRGKLSLEYETAAADFLGRLKKLLVAAYLLPGLILLLILAVGVLK